MCWVLSLAYGASGRGWHRDNEGALGWKGFNPALLLLSCFSPLVGGENGTRVGNGAGQLKLVTIPALLGVASVCPSLWQPPFRAGLVSPHCLLPLGPETPLCRACATRGAGRVGRGCSPRPAAGAWFICLLLVPRRGFLPRFRRLLGSAGSPAPGPTGAGVLSPRGSGRAVGVMGHSSGCHSCVLVDPP